MAYIATTIRTICPFCGDMNTQQNKTLSQRLTQYDDKSIFMHRSCMNELYMVNTAANVRIGCE